MRINIEGGGVGVKRSSGRRVQATHVTQVMAEGVAFFFPPPVTAIALHIFMAAVDREAVRLRFLHCLPQVVPSA